MLDIKNLSFSYVKGKKILDNVSFHIQEGKIITLMGANGCGKSTLLGLMSKNLVPDSGTISLNGRDIKDYSLKEFAQNVAVVHQRNTAPDDLTVESLVSYGRLPYTSMFLPKLDKENRGFVERALELTDLLELRDMPLGELSGGQRQRAFIAMALAQNTKVIFLDEPTTFLDVRYQVEILRLVQKLNKEQNLTIVMVLHDISQALCYSDEVIGIYEGKIVVQGKPHSVIDQEIIHKLYGIQLPIVQNEDGSIFVMTV